MSGTGKSPPILRLAVSAADPADDERLQRALVEIAGQVSEVSINPQPQDGLYRIEGRAESDLDSVCDRLRDEYHLAINLGPPMAIFLETVRKQAEAEGKYIRQTGGSGNYGHCKLRLEPDQPGKGYQFINEIRGGAVPSEYINSIDQGVQDAMRQGVLAGFPVVDVKVTLYDGSYHETDSNPMAFTFAGSIAFKEAAKKASPVILEPMMLIEIEVPQEIVPAIRREISAHRGRIDHELTGNGLNEIRAVVPLSELLSVESGGLAEFPIEFSGYEPVRDSGSPDDGKAGVTANKPNYPRHGSRSEMAPWIPEEE